MLILNQEVYLSITLINKQEGLYKWYAMKGVVTGFKSWGSLEVDVGDIIPYIIQPAFLCSSFDLAKKEAMERNKKLNISRQKLKLA